MWIHVQSVWCVRMCVKVVSFLFCCGIYDGWLGPHYCLLSSDLICVVFVWFSFVVLTSRTHTGKTHGAPGDEERMVGDLGNITVDESGHCTVQLEDSRVQLIGPHSVIGRSLLIAAGEDDQGRGGHEQSMTTGNVGPKVAAGVIGLVVKNATLQ